MATGLFNILVVIATSLAACYPSVISIAGTQLSFCNLTQESLGLWLSSSYPGNRRKLKAAVTGRLQKGLIDLTVYNTNLWDHTQAPLPVLAFIRNSCTQASEVITIIIASSTTWAVAFLPFFCYY